MLEDGLVGGQVVVPVLALLDVARVELPVLLRRVDARQLAAALLVLRDVQVDLDNVGAVVHQVLLEVVDFLEPLLPEPLAQCSRREALAVEELRMDAHHQHFLVVRAVEDADVAARRERLDRTPEEVVIEFIGRWAP